MHARGRLAQALLGRRLKKPNPLLLPSAIQTRDFPLKSRLQQLVTRVAWALPVPVENQVPRQRGCCLPHKLPEAPPQPRASEPYFRVSAYPVLYSESTQRCWTGWCAPAGPPGVEAGCALPQGAHPLALGTVIAICSVRSFHLSPLPLRVQRTGTWSRVPSGANGITTAPLPACQPLLPRHSKLLLAFLGPGLSCHGPVTRNWASPAHRPSQTTIALLGMIRKAKQGAWGSVCLQVLGEAVLLLVLLPDPGVS